MAEQMLSLKDIDNMTNKKARVSKRMRIEKLNMAASFKIAAHNKLMQTERDTTLGDIKNQVSKQIKDGNIPTDAYMSVFNSRVTLLQSRVDVLEEKEARVGALTRGEKASLVDYQEALAKVKGEKNDFITNQKNEEDRISRERAAQLIEERKLAEKRKRDKELAESNALEEERRIEAEKRKLTTN